ncbi:hypothetical protein M427DRAFT_54843 [Gonapodya prolifera JEL478]|uniref:Uncharacterized protein n=1 Tax=Gonapodya prolifera (strain JEL478) TaxID=1344416 RepID=A0A139AKZ9_GONPJ|nr:hypothetical protein M427DRAFT_54843 [Gonapodya prolifera JEL478]|eukprot:KXS17194.1 hypothetical protein M427DRAFT_54843 [Gonapodya prolifera JEL478]
MGPPPPTAAWLCTAPASSDAAVPVTVGAGADVGAPVEAEGTFVLAAVRTDTDPLAMLADMVPIETDALALGTVLVNVCRAIAPHPTPSKGRQEIPSSQVTWHVRDPTVGSKKHPIVLFMGGGPHFCVPQVPPVHVWAVYPFGFMGLLHAQ